ncbi:hypothetical protein V6Z12_D11G277000 [Gossypium hirsutum]
MHQAGYGATLLHQPGYGAAPQHQPGYGTASLHHLGYGAPPSHQAGYGVAPSHQAEFGAVPSHQAGYGAAPLHQPGYVVTPSHQAGYGAALSHHSGYGVAPLHQLGDRAAQHQPGYGAAPMYQPGYGGNYLPPEYGSYNYITTPGHVQPCGHGTSEGRFDHHGHNRPYSPSITHHSSYPGSASNPSMKPTVKIFCKSDPNLNLSVRDNKVVLAKANPSDEHQLWYKDDKFGSNVKDEEGFPGFALVNKATGLALKHASGATQLVQLEPFKPYEFDKSLMWSEGKVIDNEGYRAIRMANDIHLNMDAYLGDRPQVQDGNEIGLWEWNSGNNQIWKISPHSPGHEKQGCHASSEGRLEHHGHDGPYSSSDTHHSSHFDSASSLSKKPAVKIFCKSDPNLNLSVRDNKVVLAKANPSDEHQLWYKDDKFGSNVKDEEGSPGFALVNKATGLALKHASGATQLVQLERFKANEFDKSLIWSEGKVIDNEGYRAIRMANDIHLNMDAYLGDRPQVQDGNEIGLWEWNSGNNQIWKISPHSVSGHEKHGGHKFGEGRSDCHGNDCPYSSSHTHHSNHSGHASNLSKEPTVKICCKADPKLNLSVRFDKVVLAKADPYDEHQHWFKDDKFGSNVKDEEGFPGFALVNKATGLALKHACGAAQPVRIIHCLVFFFA